MERGDQGQLINGYTLRLYPNPLHNEVACEY